jgi:hypothetical protein
MTVYDSVRRGGLYNILIGFRIPIYEFSKTNKIVSKRKLYQISADKHMYDMIHVKSGMKQDALSALLFNFALEYAIGRVQVNQDGFKLIGADQLLVFADDVNVWGGSTHTIKKNTEAV